MNSLQSINGIILMGSPGSGKGTIGSYIAKINKQYVHVSSGDLLRDEVNNSTPIGLEIKTVIKDGGQISDKIVTDLVLKTLKNLVNQKQSFVLDGFPQTEEQRDSWDCFVNENTSLKSRYIYCVIDSSKALSRMSTRLSCEKCHSVFNKTMFSAGESSSCVTCKLPLKARESDQLGKAEKRLYLFQSITKPVVEKIIGSRPGDVFILDSDCSITDLQSESEKIVSGLQLLEDKAEDV